jgi:para-nitrobenzyl esterase
VLVWIHGGGYINYSANSDMYDGARLAKKGDAVVVSMNHRLNLFGFLYLGGFDPAYADSGNVGMLDLVLALEWVRDNIAAFGGDPGNVTIFGQSGGGAKSAVLMAMPKARGLFHKVWTMSGQQVTNRRSAPASSAPCRTRQSSTCSALRDPVLPFGGVSFAPVLDERNLLRHPFYPDAPAAVRQYPDDDRQHARRDARLPGRRPGQLRPHWAGLPAKLTLAQHAASTLIRRTGDRPNIAELYPAYSRGAMCSSPPPPPASSWRGAI